MTKTIDCTKCGKRKDVSDDWTFKLCPVCRDKILERRLLERKACEAREGLDVEKHPIISSYGHFQREYVRVWKKPCSFEEYLRECERYRIQQRVQREEATFTVQKQLRREAEILNEASFRFENGDCKTYRLLRAKDRRSPEEDEFLGSHIYKCRTCTDWLERFKSYREEPNQNVPEGDMRGWDTRNDGSKGAWDKGTPEEESYEDRARRIQRESNMNPDFKRSSNESENILFGEHDTDKGLERSDFDDKKPKKPKKR